MLIILYSKYGASVCQETTNLANIRILCVDEKRDKRKIKYLIYTSFVL